MTDRPDQFPDFALLNRQDPILNVPNVLKPNSSHIDFGWSFKEPAPMNWMNWIHRYSALWIRYIDERLNKPESYTVSTLPSASTAGAGSLVFVTNDVGGAVPAFSDGTNWRRVTDRAVVSLT